MTLEEFRSLTKDLPGDFTLSVFFGHSEHDVEVANVHNHARIVNIYAEVEYGEEE